MAVGDKKPVVMEEDMAVPGGIATLGTDGKLASEQIPGLEALGAIEYINSLPFTRKNLLDNWYFADPVNQRGQMSYVGDGYTIDRWKFDNAIATVSIEIESGGIKIINGNGASHGIIQFFEKDILGGKQVTYSMLYKGDACGIWSYGHNQYFPASADWSLVSMTFIAPTGTDASQWYAAISPAAFSTTQIKAVKLEPGSTQTLARQDENGNWVLNEISDYGDELRRCQRYYEDLGTFRVYRGARDPWSLATEMSKYLFKVTKRAIPVVTLRYTLPSDPNTIHEAIASHPDVYGFIDYSLVFQGEDYVNFVYATANSEL